MADREKLVAKFLTDKLHITIEDCDRLLTSFGYDLRKSGGSHRVYHKKGAASITVINPKRSKYIVSPYVNRLIKDLELEK